MDFICEMLCFMYMYLVISTVHSFLNVFIQQQWFCLNLFLFWGILVWTFVHVIVVTSVTAFKGAW